MSFLSNQELEEILPKCIEPYIPGNLENAAYELRLGNEYFATNTEEGVKTIIEEGKQITIKPGQCALLLTKETVTIPNNLLAFISIKATFKFGGLVNVSGFHVDPGFHGKLMFAVYNAGSADTVLTEGEKLFPIWFCELTNTLEEKDAYDGKSNNRSSITSQDVMRIHGEIFSPNVLYEKIKELENTKIKDLEKGFGEVNTKRTVILTICGSIFLLALSIFVNTLLNNSSYQVGEKQGQIETKVDSIYGKTAEQENSLKEIQQRLVDIEKKVDRSNSNVGKK
jgi:dCTP deaminase